MGEELNMHYVCTRDEARKLIDQQSRFWVSDCGCRTGNEKGCKRSRVDVCLWWNGGEGSAGSGTKEVTRAQVEEILKEAETKHLVSRPFRNWDNETKKVMPGTAGICFCCDCCCGYFSKRNGIVNEGGDFECDKGDLAEKTDFDSCTDCGACVDVCYFDARKMENGKLAVKHSECYGCGLCMDVCPVSCIEMAPAK